ncbi:11418_t:CDS:2 [Paraglomus brasilianum]|uniref:11418_t:CDS:1 n=1 Tax=Paraglomus brasilianum TaxID=144538 RepID=A0A9N9FDP0_9GLOM|nr:11418_t:CDS:2 [Paraglomus brasilianum]
MARIRYRFTEEKKRCYFKCYCFSCLFIIVAAIIIPITIALLKKDLQITFVGVIPSPDETISYADNNTAFTANAGFLRFNVFNSLSVKTTARISAKLSVAKSYILSLTLYSRKAYYSFGYTNNYFYKDDYFGIGSLDTHLKAKSNTTIDVPFSIDYNTNRDYNLPIINDIINKCGFTGNKPLPLQIYYTVKFTQDIIVFITLSVNDCNGFTDIDCPFKDGKVPPIPGVYIGNSTAKN